MEDKDREQRRLNELARQERIKNVKPSTGGPAPRKQCFAAKYKYSAYPGEKVSEYEERMRLTLNSKECQTPNPTAEAGTQTEGSKEMGTQTD